MYMGRLVGVGGQVAEKGPIGLTQHPHRNLVATWADEGGLKLWKA